MPQKANAFIGERGESFLWRPLEDRIREFWDKFPASDGWSVRRTVTPYPFSAQTFELIKVCIERSVDPASYGLSLPTPQVSVTAELLDKDGKVRATATAYAPDLNAVAEESSTRTVETIEGRALSRLLSLLGISGGPAPDYDEGLVPAPARAAVPAPTPKVVPISEPAAARPNRDQDEAPPVVVTPPAPAPDAGSNPGPVSPAPAASAPPSTGPNGVPVAIEAQIRAVAQNKGLEVPSYSNLDEARQVLRDLRAAPRSL